jgi:hypothetical protein
MSEVIRKLFGEASSPRKLIAPHCVREVRKFPGICRGVKKYKFAQHIAEAAGQSRLHFTSRVSCPLTVTELGPLDCNTEAGYIYGMSDMPLIRMKKKWQSVAFNDI